MIQVIFSTKMYDVKTSGKPAQDLSNKLIYGNSSYTITIMVGFLTMNPHIFIPFSDPF